MQLMVDLKAYMISGSTFKFSKIISCDKHSSEEDIVKNINESIFKSEARIPSILCHGDSKNLVMINASNIELVKVEKVSEICE